jgi:adenylosuccinate lyase
MPHKKNPISSENLSGCARLLRSYALAALENQALWHERDMSHSSVERVILPDACLILDYALDRLSGVLKSLVVDRVQMVGTLKNAASLAFSSQRLFEGLTSLDSTAERQAVYEQIQKQSFESGASPLTEDEWNQRSHQVIQAVERIFAFNSNTNRKET